MYHSAAFQIPPLRLRSTTGIQRRQVADIVVIIHFSPFLSFPSFSSPPTLNLSPLHPNHHPHSCPVASDHSTSEVRSCLPADSHLRSKPTPSLCQGMSETGNVSHPSAHGIPTDLRNRHSRGWVPAECLEQKMLYAYATVCTQGDFTLSRK